MQIWNTAKDGIAKFFGYVKAKGDETVQAEIRSGIYAANQMLYDGSIYQTRNNGGAMEDVLKTYIGPNYQDVNRFSIQPFCLPFGEIVDTYQYVLPGTWGAGVEVADQVDGVDVNRVILDPLRQLWRQSNWDTEKGKLFRWAANFGTVGVRITGTPAKSDQPARVTMGVDHPSRLFNFEEDSLGNVTAVCLKYTQQVNFGTLAEPDWHPVEVVEQITKEEFSRTQDGIEQIEDADRTNPLGFCPYVILRHKDNGTPYGDWAYKGIEAPVHRLNWRITRQDKSIDRHQFPKWFATAGGAAPASDISMGDDAMSYVQTMVGTPPPTLEALVAKIDQASAQAFWAELREMIRSRQPEMNLNALSLLANLSGETIAQVLKPTEKCIEDVRPAYWHAMIRAMQMGLSAGVTAGAWDLGTGVGTAEAGDRAYRTGVEAFTFKAVPALPPTVYQIVQQANADQAEAAAKLSTASKAKAIGVSQKEQFRLAGYTDKQIKTMEAELANQDDLPTEDDNANN